MNKTPEQRSPKAIEAKAIGETMECPYCDRDAKMCNCLPEMKSVSESDLKVGSTANKLIDMKDRMPVRDEYLGEQNILLYNIDTGVFELLRVGNSEYPEGFKPEYFLGETHWIDCIRLLTAKMFEHQ